MSDTYHRKLDYFNPRANPAVARILYILDRRAWENRNPKPHEIKENYSTLMEIVSNTFKDTLYLRRVIVSNKSFSSFKYDLITIKPAVVAIYKHLDDVNDYNDYDIFQLLKSNTTNDDFYILVKCPESKEKPQQYYKKFSEYWEILETGIERKFKLKDYVISYLSKIDEIMIIANDIIANPQHYKGQKKKIHSLSELISYKKN